MISLPIVERKVACGTCRACCQNHQAIIIGEPFGDDMSYFAAHSLPAPGKPRWRVLRHKKSGDCVFLSRRTGCTIYGKRPAMCRNYDCVDLLRRGMTDDMPPAIRRAAKIRLRRASFSLTTPADVFQLHDSEEPGDG